MSVNFIRNIFFSLLLLLPWQGVLAKSVVISGVEFDVSETDQTLVIANAKKVQDANVVIPQKIEYEGVAYTVIGIGEKAFYRNDSIRSVTLPDGLVSLGAYAFGHCSQLTEVNVPASVSSLGEGAFYGCSTLETVNFGKRENGLQIKSNMFYSCSALKDLGDLHPVDSIGYMAFANCQSLTGKLDLRSVRFIDAKAFYKCGAISEISFGENCSIGEYAFYGCKKLGMVNLTNPSQIAHHSFMGCYTIKTLVLRYTRQYDLEAIGDSCFERCDALETVKIMDYSGYNDGQYDPSLAVEVCKLGADVFPLTSSLKEIFVPENRLEEYKSASDWSPYVDLLVATSDTTETERGLVESVEGGGSTETILPTLKGKRVIVFGDSKAEGVGNQVNGEYRSWAYYMQEQYGCIVTNAAVGGTHLTPTSLKPGTGVNGIGVYSLVNAWKTGNYALVDSSISWAHQSKYGTRWDHVQEIIKTTKATDYDIVCIDAGTNDWNNAARKLGNWDDTNPLQNYTVALKNIISTLYELNPNLHILIIPPIVRQLEYNDTTTFSDYYRNPRSELYLYEVAETMISVAQRCGADAIDAYHEMGFTASNWTTLYTADGTHPNEAGYRVIGDKIGAHLLSKIAPVPTKASSLPSQDLLPADAQKVTVVDLNGRVVRKNVDASKAADELPRGVYLLNGKKCVVKGK